MITWITPAGSLGILTERIPIDTQLQVTTNLGATVTYSLIAGSLPRGLKLINGEYWGSRICAQRKPFRLSPPLFPAT